MVIAALVARELGGDSRAQTLTAIEQGTGVWLAVGGHRLTPYTLEPVQWLLMGWLLVRWRRIRDDRLLLALGVVVGLIAAPTLVWQAVNGWPQLQMAPVVTAEAASLYGGRPGVALGLLVSAGLMGTVLVLFGLWRLLRAPELRDLRYLGVAFAVLYVVFVVTAGRPYYLVGLHGVLAAVAVAMLPLSVVMAAPTIGDRVAASTVRAYDALPPAQRAHTAVMGDSYIDAAFLDVQAPEGALPPASSSNRSHGWFPPPREDQDTVLYLGDDVTELRPHFTEVRRVASTGTEASVWLCSGRRGSWASIRPGLRHLTVS